MSDANTNSSLDSDPLGSNHAQESHIMSPGIWHVLQNRADLETDFAFPARRIALAWDATTSVPYMATIPLEGDYDNFLWKYDYNANDSSASKLTNKGAKKSLNWWLSFGSTYPKVEQAGQLVASPLSWSADMYGNNAFVIETTQQADYTYNRFFCDSDNVFHGPPIDDSKDQDFRQQIWIAQPMEVASDYKIAAPGPDESVSPFTMKLEVGAGITIYGTTHTSNWAMLNTELIILNMDQAIRLDKADTLSGAGAAVQFNCKVLVVSDFDVKQGIATYPIIKDYFTSEQIKQGGTAFSNSNVIIVIVYESLMCQKGGGSLNSADTETIREFGQLMEMFGYIIGKVIPFDEPPGTQPPVDRGQWLMQRVETWFHSPNEERSALEKPERDVLETIFNKSNTWLPPRWLRNQRT